MQETQLNGESLDIVSENVTKLKELFPEIVTEDKIDFDKLKTVLGNYTEDDSERYNFTWKGKADALRLAQTPSTGTLRPCKEESKNWDTTENLYIEGDNLEVLKILQKSYYGKIKMIYIDPPYNTGHNFVYQDNYKDNLYNYLDLTNQVDPTGHKKNILLESDGRRHTKWLNMMYPRLRLARSLLRDDGVIFISIDDIEVENLKKMCNELFGEENFVANIIWQKKYSPQNDATYFSNMHDHILCYAKMKKQSANEIIGWDRNLLPRTEKQNSRYFNRDNDPRGPWMSDNLSVKTYSSNCDYEIVTPSGKIINPPKGGCWRVNPEKFSELVKDNRIWFGKDGSNVPRIKRFLSEAKQGIVPSTIWFREEVGDNQEAAKEIRSIFDSFLFDTPKPTRLIKRMLELSTDKKSNDIFLDFFSGSGSTAHAVLNLNSEDKGNRRFILIQIPETIDENKEAYKKGFKTISEIGKERIRRAGDNILSEIEGNRQTSLDTEKNAKCNLDIGFKVFKLDSSNLSKWDPEYDNIEQTLLDSVKNLVPGRSELDLIYEIMLKYGIDLTLPIEEFEVNNGKIIYSIGFGALLICLSENLDVSIAKEILKLKEELSPEIMRVVFKDNGFATDSDKTNIKETLQTHGIDEFVTI